MSELVDPIMDRRNLHIFKDTLSPEEASMIILSSQREHDAGARPSRESCPLPTRPTRLDNNTRRGQAAKTLSSRALEHC
eukprot:scaffold10961_cov75-Skeletonema_dohrnii-CCMP3373.AAC.2